MKRNIAHRCFAAIASACFVLAATLLWCAAPATAQQRVPSHLRITRPGSVRPGETIAIRVELLEKRSHKSLADKEVTLRFNNAEVGRQRTNRNGVADFSLTVPTNTPYRTARIEARFAGDDAVAAGSTTGSIAVPKPSSSNGSQGGFGGSSGGGGSNSGNTTTALSLSDAVASRGKAELTARLTRGGAGVSGVTIRFVLMDDAAHSNPFGNNSDLRTYGGQVRRAVTNASGYARATFTPIVEISPSGDPKWQNGYPVRLSASAAVENNAQFASLTATSTVTVSR